MVIRGLLSLPSTFIPDSLVYFSAMVIQPITVWVIASREWGAGHMCGESFMMMP